MEYDVDYFVKNTVQNGKMTREYYGSVLNPIANIALDYADAVLLSARRERRASVENLSIEADQLDGFQYFYVDDTEVTTSAWNQALLELLDLRFAQVFAVGEG